MAYFEAASSSTQNLTHDALGCLKLILVIILLHLVVIQVIQRPIVPPTELPSHWSLLWATHVVMHPEG